MSDEMKEVCDAKIKQIKYIITEHKKGKSTKQIATKAKAAESYVVDVAKKGEEKAISDTKRLYGFSDDDVNSQGMIPSTHEYLCEDCGATLIDGKPEKGENDYIFRTLFCVKCNKKYYNPLDMRRYLYNKEE